jgi:diaminopimelate decarboxylase
VILDEMTLSTDLVTRTEDGALPKAEPLAPVDETMLLRRCAWYRDGFKGTAVSYPAALLRFTTTRDWIQRHGVAVDVTTDGELAQALVSGTDPGRIVLHPRDGIGEPTRRAVNVEAGRFIVRSSRHISRLAAHTQQRRQQVLIDATADTVGDLASDVLAHRELDLVGVHCRLQPGDVVGALTMSRAIDEMAWIRRRYDVLVTQISLANLDVGERCERWILRRVTAAISEVIDDACARHRFPRPALTLAPSRGALLLGQ